MSVCATMGETEGTGKMSERKCADYAFLWFKKIMNLWNFRKQTFHY